MSVDSGLDARELAFTWQAVLGRLELDLAPHNYETWLQGSRALADEDGCLIVEAPNSFNLDWMNEQLQFVTQRAFEEVSGERRSIRFVARQAVDMAEDARPRAGRPARKVVAGTLNRRFTFERYLPAEGNRVALHSCGALLSDRGAPVSPVVVFGPPGMGKTHLLHAAAARTAEAGEAVACLSAEEFTSRYQGALRQNSVQAFQETMRAVRLLVLDDLQYLAGKKATQDELVHTIDAITNAGGAVAIGSERHPADLELPERLASRLRAGIVVRVEPFRLHEREAFITRLADELGTPLPAWAVARIADVEVPSVRVLQGAVHAAVAIANCEMLDLGRLDEELTRITRAETVRTITDGELLALVAGYFELTVEDLAGRSRKAAMTTARAAAAAALRQRGRSLREIGTVLGRDHSTARDLADRGAAVLGADSELRRRVAG